MPGIADQIGASIDSLTQEFELITNNLANVNSAGYKRNCNYFSRVLQSQISGADEDVSFDVGLSSAIDFSQAGISHTGRTLDMALSGKGFFVIETPDGPLYTRNGIFETNQNGQIVNLAGNIVAGQNGAINIPREMAISDVHVAGNGSISVAGVQIGKFKLVDFGDNEDKLVPRGGGCFTLSEDIRTDDAENVVVKQGYQESSNVQMVEELVDMIMVTRLYEANMKSITATKKASDSLINLAMG